MEVFEITMKFMQLQIRLNKKTRGVEFPAIFFAKKNRNRTHLDRKANDCNRPSTGSSKSKYFLSTDNCH